MKPRYRAITTTHQRHRVQKSYTWFVWYNISEYDTEDKAINAAKSLAHMQTLKEQERLQSIDWPYPDVGW